MCNDYIFSFKQCLEDDIDDVFFNCDELAEIMTVDSKDIRVVKDDDKLMKFNSNLSEGLINGELLFYAPISDFDNKLFVGKEVYHRKKHYLIINLSENEGLYTIVLAGKQ